MRSARRRMAQVSIALACRATAGILRSFEVPTAWKGFYSTQTLASHTSCFVITFHTRRRVCRIHPRERREHGTGLLLELGDERDSEKAGPSLRRTW